MTSGGRVWGESLPRFASTEDRDRRYAEYVAAGGKVYAGTLCWVGDDLCAYVGTGWTVYPPTVTR